MSSCAYMVIKSVDDLATASNRNYSKTRRSMYRAKIHLRLYYGSQENSVFIKTLVGFLHCAVVRISPIITAIK